MRLRHGWRRAAWALAYDLLDAVQRRQRKLLGGWRVARLLMLAARGWLTVRFIFPRLDEAGRDLRVRDWSQRMLRALGVRVNVQGDPPAHGPALLVANHLSWLDILVLHAVVHCRFVAKSEVRHWPVMGPLATAAGTLYIERASRRDALRVVHQMAAGLQAGQVLAVFPEGTTHPFGMGMLPFHGNLIQPAIAVDAPAVPVGLVYTEALSGRVSHAPEYVGDDSLVRSVWRTVSSRQDVDAWVGFGPPERAAGRDRRQWAADLRVAVRKAQI